MTDTAVAVPHAETRVPRHTDIPPGHCERQPTFDRLRDSLNTALRGKGEVVELVLACLLGRGHLLLEDLPGTGKTTLAKAVAHAVGGTFARVQCTPDLLPGDVTGFSMFDEKERQFQFQPGPVFADVLLADEINRATPRTQSALLEAMAERQVTVDNARRPLPGSFFVIATQNPVEQQGAYPLPEAQMDRFAMRLSVGYPGRASELEMLAADVGVVDIDPQTPPPVLSPEGLIELQGHVAKVAVSARVAGYLLDVARASREHPEVHIGVSPRGVLVWQRISQAWAHLEGRDFVTPDDVRHVAPAVLGVRLVGDFADPHAVVASLLERVPVPVG